MNMILRMDSSGFSIFVFDLNSLNPKPPLCKSGALPLSYEPMIMKVEMIEKKGGDPAAGSPTATL